MTTDILESIVEANSFLTLATADADGRPWSSPVWFAHRDFHEFLWISDPHARHSLNVAVRPEVALTIFDSTIAPPDAQAVYLEGAAAEVDSRELGDYIDVYSRRSQARGLRAWTTDDVTAPTRLRLYRARIGARFVLEDGRHRVSA
jgi:pyridoxine/pyridoxamine 5'-phosphate oxidase